MCSRSLFTSLGCFAIVLASGCAEEPSHDHSCHGLRAAVDGDGDPNAMPDEVIAYLGEHHHNHMHLDFHVARMWDVLGPETQEWAAGEGISRWKLQEGQAKSGLEFLAMHRLMLNELREKFPEHEALFVGWEKPPTDPQDPESPLPNGATEAFDPDMLVAVDRLENDLLAFTSDDKFALYLQTKLRPTRTNPGRRTTDRSAGIHNYLHNRFTDENSPINVGDPSVNLQNQVFWRIHGWVDARWTAYRKAMGLDDATDPVYLAAMRDARAWMDDAMARGAMQQGKADGGCDAPLPDEVKNIFVE